MNRTLVVILCVAGLAVLVLVVVAGWARWLVPGGGSLDLIDDRPHATSSSAIFMIAEGKHIAAGTTVGLHVDLGDEWEGTDGSRRGGYMTFENARLGCDVVVMVASPVKAFPHYMNDDAGSHEILKRYADGDAAGVTSFLLPTAGGGAIETLSQERTESGRSRIAIAREFGAIDSAIFVDFGCDTAEGVEQVFAREFLAKVGAFVSD